MLREHHSFFLPNLLYFTNGNTYLGSFLGLRFRVQPTTEGRGSSSRRCWPACAGMESTAWRRARWRLRPAFPWTQRAGRR